MFIIIWAIFYLNFAKITMLVDSIKNPPGMPHPRGSNSIHLRNYHLATAQFIIRRTRSESVIHLVRLYLDLQILH